VRRAGLLGAAIAVAFGAAACGSSGARSSQSASSRTGSTPTSRSATTTTPTLRVPAGAVAIVADTPITLAQFNHWELIAAKGQAAQSSGQPAIAPSDPPRFDKCVAAERKANPGFAHRPAPTIRSICAQLFKTLSDEALDLLIKADWYRDYAARLGVSPSAAKVDQTLSADKRQQFATQAQYLAFLRKTGQTEADLRLRVAVQLAVSGVLAHKTGSQDARAKSVTNEVNRIYRPQTLCAPQYVMSDCSNYRASAP
jgi:hypothetical protein